MSREKACVSFIRPFQALALGVCVLAAAFTAAAQPTAAAPASGIDSSFIDPAVRVQDDLFRHVNGGWLERTPIPPDRASTGAFEQLHEAIQPQLRTLIEEAAAARRDAEASQIGDLYASFMGEAALEKLGVKPIAAELAAIDAVADRSQLARLMARAIRAGISMPIALDIHQDGRDPTRYIADLSQGGLGLPARDYYLLDDPRFKQVRGSYLVYMARMLALAGERKTAHIARAVLALETALARAQWTQLENQDPIRIYNKVELTALPELAPGFNWASFLAGTGLAGTVGDVIVSQPSYVTALGRQIEHAPLDVWKAYAKLRMLDAYAPYLDKAFVDLRFAFAGTALRGTPENAPRWERGVALVEASLGDGLGKRYVQRHFPPAHKARMEKLVAHLLAAYRESIAALDWMSAQTRREAQAKLARFTPKIGYPARWVDYGALEIRAGDLVGNVRRAREFESARQIAKLGRPIDRDEWLMTPQTVNAYYNPEQNEIVFPASILQPPFFDPNADDAVNYGGIGAVIGHEISHGFDDQGSQYDGEGRLRDWWTPGDRERFNAKTQALVVQYGAYTPVAGYPIDGALTLGENIADNSGLEIAYKAYQLSLGGQPAPTLDGLSGQARFFYGFAQVWRGKSREAALIEQLKSNPHAPDEFRANGAVRNHPGFYSTFGVKPGDGMYLAPEERVSIW